MATYSLNKVQLIGHLGADPEVRFTQDGKPIANLRVATSESWRDQQGATQERTEWHRVVIFGKLAEIVQQYFQKGRKVYVEGKLQTKKWTDNQGQERYNTEIVVGSSTFDGSNIILLDRNPNPNSNAGEGGYAGGGSYGGGGYNQAPAPPDPYYGNMQAPAAAGYGGPAPAYNPPAQRPAAAPRPPRTSEPPRTQPPSDDFGPTADFNDDIPF